MEVHVYQTRGDKIIDFLIGFFLVGGVLEFALRLLLRSTGYTGATGWLAGAAFTGLALSAYLYQKRRYMGIGLFSALGCRVLAISPYLLLLAFH